jgi:hypothetical protein
LYLLASGAANHSCAPNAHYTFDDSTNNAITVRAIQPIQADEVVTISYGPIVGVDGTVQDRRAALLESHQFVCECTACVSEITNNTNNNNTADDDDATTMAFIDEVLISGHCTASEALQRSIHAPPRVLQPPLFRKAMRDTAIQSIFSINNTMNEDDDNDNEDVTAATLEIAVGFQQLALTALEGSSSGSEHHLEIAYDILRLLLLRHIAGMTRTTTCANTNTTSTNNNGQPETEVLLERARTILRTYYGAEDYPFQNTMDAIHCRNRIT